MMIDTIPLFLYLNTKYKTKKNKGMRALAYILIGYPLLCVVMQYGGIKDLHDMLNGALYITLIAF